MLEARGVSDKAGPQAENAFGLGLGAVDPAMTWRVGNAMTW